MSNNNLGISIHARCKCGRYATIGEWQAGIGFIGNYECPDCFHKRHTKPLTREEYYKLMGINLNQNKDE